MLFRSRAWLTRATGGDAPPDRHSAEARLADMLVGLEWSEAMLVANSFDPTMLAALAPRDLETEDEQGVENEAA